MTLLILAQKVKEEKKKNSLVLLILSLVSIFGHINSTPNAQPSFRACYEGKSVRGMTFQWRKQMDQWIKETIPSKTWGKTRRDGWEEATTHMPHASESFCESLFSFNLISQLHSVAPAFAQTHTSRIVHQCYKWSSSHSIVVTQILY